MNEKANGAQTASLSEANQPVPAEAVAKARAVLDAQLGPIVQVMIRGILSSVPGIAPHEALNSISRVTGTSLASAVKADLQTILRLRRGFKEAFDEGVNAVPALQPVGQQVRPQG